MIRVQASTRRRLVAVAMITLLVAGCSPTPGDVTTPARTEALTGRPSVERVSDALSNSAAFQADHAAPLIGCVAEALVEDSALSDETLRALVDHDLEYADSPDDLPGGEVERIESAVLTCAEQQTDGP